MVSVRRGARGDVCCERSLRHREGKTAAIVWARKGGSGSRVGVRGDKGCPRRTSVWTREARSAASIRGDMPSLREGMSATSARRGARSAARVRRGKRERGRPRRTGTVVGAMLGVLSDRYLERQSGMLLGKGRTRRQDRPRAGEAAMAGEVRAGAISAEGCSWSPS